MFHEIPEKKGYGGYTRCPIAATLHQHLPADISVFFVTFYGQPAEKVFQPMIGCGWHI